MVGSTNDLGFFPSMSTRVSKHSSRSVDELVKFVHDEFRAYYAETLDRIWEMKRRVLSSTRATMTLSCPTEKSIR
eukprot:9478375-Pyramimonas_sp.AAC.1